MATITITIQGSLSAERVRELVDATTRVCTSIGHLPTSVNVNQVEGRSNA